MTHPLYQNAKFAPYVFQEYPKMVYLTEDHYPNKGKIVNDPEEELAYLGFLMKDKYPKAENQGVANQLTIRDDAERKFLLGVLKDMGSNYDENASIEDLRAQMRGFIPQTANPALPALDAPAAVGAAVGFDLGARIGVDSDILKPVAPVEPVAPVAPIPGDALQGDEGARVA